MLGVRCFMYKCENNTVPSLETLAVWSVKIWPQNGIIKAATKANNFFLKTQESYFAVTYLGKIFGRVAKILKYWVIRRHAGGPGKHVKIKYVLIIY